MSESSLLIKAKLRSNLKQKKTPKKQTNNPNQNNSFFNLHQVSSKGKKNSSRNQTWSLSVSLKES